MPKRKAPEPTPEEQFKEFLKTARELEVDESREVLERVFKKLSPRKRKAMKSRTTGSRHG